MNLSFILFYLQLLLPRDSISSENKQNCTNLYDTKDMYIYITFEIKLKMEIRKIEKREKKDNSDSKK